MVTDRQQHSRYPSISNLAAAMEIIGVIGAILFFTPVGWIVLGDLLLLTSAGSEYHSQIMDPNCAVCGGTRKRIDGGVCRCIR